MLRNTLLSLFALCTTFTVVASENSEPKLKISIIRDCVEKDSFFSCGCKKKGTSIVLIADNKRPLQDEQCIGEIDNVEVIACECELHEDSIGETNDKALA